MAPYKPEKKTGEKQSITRVRYLCTEMYDALIGLRSDGTESDDDDSVFVVEFCRRRLLPGLSSSCSDASTSAVTGRLY